MGEVCGRSVGTVGRAKVGRLESQITEHEFPDKKPLGQCSAHRIINGPPASHMGVPVPVLAPETLI